MSKKSRRSRSNRPKGIHAQMRRATLPPEGPEVAPEGSDVAAEGPKTEGPEAEGPEKVVACGFASAADLPVKFFDELPSEAWLAHELELRDPRSLRKMTDGAARRRAHFAKYVVGVVAVSAALCVAALVKSAVPGGHRDSMAPASIQGSGPDARPDVGHAGPTSAPVDTGLGRGR